MLPKIWKKLLLAICIIACLFNVTAKIVNRVSLDKVIASQKEGVNVKELLNITDEKPVVSPVTNSISVYNEVDEDNVIQNDEQDEEDIVNDDEFEEEPIEDNEEENSKVVTQEDFFDKIFNDSAFTSIVGN